MWAEIIANPASGNYNSVRLEKCASILRKKFSAVRITLTSKPEEAKKLAARSDADVVVAAGGDGLINETAAGMLDKETLFAVLPFGTVNVFCREHGIHLNPEKAAKRLDVRDKQRISLGFLGQRPFLLMCGIGYDAYVVQSVIAKKHKGNKTLAHIVEGINALGKKYPKLKLYMNGNEYEFYHAVISLGYRYAGNFKLSKDIKESSLNIFIQENPKKLLDSIVSIAVGGGFPAKPAHSENIKITGTSDFQIDGEYVHTETDQNYINIKRDALTLIR